MQEIFLDTAYAIALSAPTDKHHQQAVHCISFVVMSDRGIHSGLTTDEHFQQAGFRALMRDPSPEP